MNKSLFFPVLAIAALAIMALACGVSVPPSTLNENCQPTAISVATMAIDNELNWVSLGEDGRYDACGLSVWTYSSQMSYQFQVGVSNNYTPYETMLKVEFSDGSIRWFKVVSGWGSTLYMAQ